MRVPYRAAATLAMILGLGIAGCSKTSNAEEQKSAKSTATEATAPSAESAEPERIAMGETVNLSDHLVEGQITVFDFMSDYCGPCRQFAPWLDRLHKERPGVSVVKVDINRPGVRGIDWGSPVARQFHLQSIPHFKIFAADGSLMGEGQTANAILQNWLRELPTEG